MFSSPLVVGYKGEIGSYLLNGLLKQMPKALDILCFDVNETPEEKKKRIEQSDCIFLCVPLNITKNWLKFWEPELGDKLIFEQCSLKSALYRKYKNLNLFPMHLLFRPSITPDKKDRRCSILQEFHGKEIEKWLEPIVNASIVYFKDVYEHDSEMARQQALIHRVILSLDKVLGVHPSRTYISAKVGELANRIKGGDENLYKIIQSNKQLPEILKEFKKEVDNFKY